MTETTDKEKFIYLFKTMGVDYEDMSWNVRWYEKHRTKNTKEEQATTALGVSQAWFLFDEAGNYVGVKDDEMGVFTPRAEGGVNEGR